MATTHEILVNDFIEAVEEAADHDLRVAAHRLTQALLDLHRTGLSRMLEIATHDTITRYEQDESVRTMLELHGLHDSPHAPPQTTPHTTH